MVWRVDVGMSSGVLNAMPQVCCKQLSPPAAQPVSFMLKHRAHWVHI